MMYCLNCHLDFDDRQTKCRECGAALVSAIDAESGDPYATLSWKVASSPETPHQDTSEATLDADVTTIDANSQTLDVDIPNDGRDFSIDGDSTANANNATLDIERPTSESDFSIDLPGFKPSSDATLDSDATHDSSDVDFTLDVDKTTSPDSDFTVDLDPSYARDPDATLDSVELDRRQDATLDAPSLGTANSDKTRTDLNDQTLDSSAGQSAASNASAGGRVSQIWAGMVHTHATPTSALRSEGQASESVFELVAKRSVEEQSPNPGSIPDYRLIRKVGEGAMGVVYSARQKAIGRIVALKAIKPSHQQNAESRRKFFYEAQITGELDHPNIVPIHELGASETGMLFYSMKLIGGTEWKDVIKKKTRDENLEILLKVCDAIAFAHSKGVIHRDLKPENTMLGTYGEVFVTDWGLAVNIEQKREFSLGGTPAYMAPEMAAHDLSKIGPASDIYILGGILYQIVAGRGPHPGKTVTECLRAALRNEIIPYAHRDPLLDIAYRAMAKDPKERYATVEDLQAAIRQYRRNAESIAIALRCDELLQQAVADKDYEKFSRTIFGYRDALELWPENKDASLGLAKARFAYGQSAFDRADYDLCLGILDSNVHEEAALYEQASKAKKLLEERERRFKGLRRILTSTILAAVVGLTFLSIYAMYERGRAVRQQKIAEEASEQEKVAKEEAIQERNNAVAAKEEEEKAKQTALVKQQEAEIARADALAKKLEAEEAKIAESQAKVEAIQKRYEAEQASKAEAAAKQLAEQKAAEVQLGNYQSTLALAKAQLEQFDTAGSRNNLDSIKRIDSEIFEKNQTVPIVDSWAWRRINLLSNTHLPRLRFNSPITAIDTAADEGLAVFGTSDGKVGLVNLNASALTERKSYQAEYPIDAVSLAPDGKQVIFSTTSEGVANTVHVWDVESDARPHPVKSLGKRSIQKILVSPDGNHVVAGLNGGLWGWRRDGVAWYDREPDFRIETLRGRLVSLQFLQADRVLIVASLNQKKNIHVVDLVNPNASQLIDLPPQIASSVQAAAWSQSAGGLLLGTDSGQLLFGSVNQDGTLMPPAEILPKRHQTSVRSIEVHSDGSAVTISEEPVAHVWRADAKVASGWNYDTYLAGSLGNLEHCRFLGSSDWVLGVDQQQTAILWSIRRQKQLRGLQRIDQSSPANLSYASPVVSTLPLSSAAAMSLDKYGVADFWDPQTGRSIRPWVDGQDKDAAEHDIDQMTSRWHYAGHTPGAKLIDVAIDEAADMLVTAASLQNAVAGYIEGDLKNRYEVCIWQLSNGQPLKRWMREADLEQRISLLGNGKLLLLAGDKSTDIVSLEDGSNVFSKSDFGAYFAITNPKNPNLAMLVKRSGAVRVFDVSHEDSWDNPDFRDFSLANNNAVPIRGVWSPNGERFYLIFSTGKIASFGWNGRKLDLLPASSSSGQIARGDEATQASFDLKGLRLQSHFELDVYLESIGESDHLWLVHRRAGREATTQTDVIAFSRSTGQTTLFKSENLQGSYYLDSADASPTLVPREAMPKATSQVLGATTSQNWLLTVHDDSMVRGLHRTSRQSRAWGRPMLRHGIMAHAGNVGFMLHEGGWLARWKINEDGFQWQPIPQQFPDAVDIKLSPNGTWLAIQSRGSDAKNTNNNKSIVTIVDSNNLKTVSTVADVEDTVWHPGDQDRLITVTGDGSIRTMHCNAPETKNSIVEWGSISLQPKERVIELQTFAEQWQNGIAPTRHLLIHTEIDGLRDNAERSGRLYFVPMRFESDDDTLPNATAPIVQASIELARGAVIAPSPTESLFAIGQDGMVTLWMGLPTLVAPRPLYSLESHRGAKLESLTFTLDGKTLISTDDQNRLFVWLSEDTEVASVSFE